MRKNAIVPNSGIFSGRDFSHIGAGWLKRTQAPPKAPAAPKPQAQQPQQQPAGAPANSYGQALSNSYQSQNNFHPLDPRGPQGFATWAGALRPITEPILGVGGMPALMSIYGAISGNRDWQTATQQGRSPKAAPTDLLNSPQLKLSTFVKRAENHVLNPFGVYKAPEPQSGPEMPQQPEIRNPTFGDYAKHLGPSLGGYFAAGPIVGRAAGYGGAKGLSAAISNPLIASKFIPKGIPTFAAGLALDNLGNMGSELAEAFRDGGFDMQGFEREIGSMPYGSAAWNARNNQIKSIASLGRFAGWDANPFTQAAFNPEEREGWRRVFSGKGLRAGTNTSIPLTMLNHAAQKPWKPMESFRPGGKYFDDEELQHIIQNRYHPTYNRQGEVGRPGFIGRAWDKIWN